jgi:hypothetical protein
VIASRPDRLAWPPCAAALIALCGCATEEVTNFGDPTRVTTSGGSQVSSATTGPSCDFKTTGCSVSWLEDIYKPIINSSKTSPPGGGCTAANCHLTPNGKLQLDPNDPNKAYAALTGYFNDSLGGKYVVPCSAKDSKLMCNFNWADDVKNDYGLCGSLMPKLISGGPVKVKLNQAQYDNLKTWIQECGAPKN